MDSINNRVESQYSLDSDTTHSTDSNSSSSSISATRHLNQHSRRSSTAYASNDQDLRAAAHNGAPNHAAVPQVPLEAEQPNDTASIPSLISAARLIPSPAPSDEDEMSVVADSPSLASEDTLRAVLSLSHRPTTRTTRSTSAPTRLAQQQAQARQASGDPFANIELNLLEEGALTPALEATHLNHLSRVIDGLLQPIHQNSLDKPALRDHLLQHVQNNQLATRLLTNRSELHKLTYAYAIETQLKSMYPEIQRVSNGARYTTRLTLAVLHANSRSIKQLINEPERLRQQSTTVAAKFLVEDLLNQHSYTLPNQMNMDTFVDSLVENLTQRTPWTHSSQNQTQLSQAAKIKVLAFEIGQLDLPIPADECQRIATNIVDTDLRNDTFIFDDCLRTPQTLRSQHDILKLRVGLAVHGM